MQSVLFIAVVTLTFTVSSYGDDTQFVEHDANRLILGKVSVNRVAHKACIDTGSSLTIFHGTDEKPCLNGFRTSQVRIRVAGDLVSKRVHRDVPVIIPGCDEELCDIIESDLTVFPGLIKNGIDVVVGMNYLRRYVLTLNDGEATSLTRVPPESFSQDRIRCVVSSGLPRVPLGLPGGRSIDAFVDTGMDSYGELPKETIAWLEAHGHAKKQNSRSRYTGRGKMDVDIYTLRWSQLGDVRLANVPIVRSDRAVVGLKMLHHLKCVFNFPDEVLAVSPLSGTAEIACEVDASGAGIAFNNERRALITAIWKGFPADNLRIAVGDELLTVERVPVERLSIRQIDDILSQAGETVHLKLKSGEREYEVDLKLDRPFEYPPKWEPEDPNAVPRPFPKLEPEKK